MKHFISMLMLILFSVNGFSQQLWNDVGRIPQDFQVDWTPAGISPLTRSAQFKINILEDFETGTIDDRIQSAINFSGIPP